MSVRQLSRIRITSPSGMHLVGTQCVRPPFASLSPRLGCTIRNGSAVASDEDPRKYRHGGYHPVYPGEVFQGRYQIVSKLGYGVYSTVWLARDLSSSRHSLHVALKVLTADSYGGAEPNYELEILEHIRRIETGHPGYARVGHLSDSFIHHGPNGNHLCLVQEVMGQSVLKLQQAFSTKQLPAAIAKRIARQILQALDWLHNSCGVIHTDIKADNILIERPDTGGAVDQHFAKLAEVEAYQSADAALKSSPVDGDRGRSTRLELDIKIIDFGVASWTDKHLTEHIQPPSLRAPEVFLGAPWDSSVDIWNFACLIYELVQGRVLFRGRPGPNNAWTAEEDQIAQMIELFGSLPQSLRERGTFSSRYFDDDGNLLHIQQLYPCSLESLLSQNKNSSVLREDYDLFEQFLKAMLKYEPNERKTAQELLKHPWLST